MQLLDAPVSGGPAGAKTGKLAIWVGGDKAVFDKHKQVLDAIGDQARYIGPIGAGDGRQAGAQLRRLCHPDRAGRGLHHGRQGRRGAAGAVGGRAQGARRPPPHVRPPGDQFLIDKYDPPAFALKLAHKDVTLATELGRELGVPMRVANLALEELTEALQPRLGASATAASPMLLQVERAGVEIKADPAAVQEVLDADKG